MSARQLLEDFGHAIRTFLDLDEEGEISAWDRVAVFRMDSTARDVFSELPAADKPPRAWLLMTRVVEGEKIYTMWWCPESGVPSDTWPVVDVSESGDAQVVALTASDFIDAMLYSCGALGGGSEEDLDAAREEASGAATGLATDLMEELDRELGNAEKLGERYELAQDKWADAWMDAVEGLDA